MKTSKLLQLFTILILLTSCKKDYYSSGKQFYENGQYKNAISNLESVSNDNEHYKEAQKLLKLSDSILKKKEIIKFKKDSILKVNEQIKTDSINKVKKIANEKNEIIRLKKELNDIKTFNGKKYKNEVTSLIIEVALFSSWGEMAQTAQSDTNKQIRKLGNQIEYQLKRLQIREFPKLRKSYGKILKNKLWEQDITVSVFGKGYKTIQLIGGTFAANKNKKDFQNAINETLDDLRFKRINYKWYKYDDTYTYYKLTNEKDSKIKIY